ncbi:hypothetical protein BH24CHL6_BH24CHL6_17070 [soil metagenome]
MVIGQPVLWLMGAVGFALRGGLLLLMASIVVLPTPIELRMLIGANLGSTGLTPGFLAFLAGGAVLAALLVLAVLALLAYFELATFERLVRDPEAVRPDEGRHLKAPDAAQRRALLAGLVLIQLLTLAALVVAALPALNAALALAHQEIIRPSLGGMIYVRVLNGVREPLFILLAGLVLSEMVSSLATRRLLVRGFGLGAKRPPRGVVESARAPVRAVIGSLWRPLRRPISTLATLILVWSATLAVVAPLSWALTAAWTPVRNAYLSPAAAADAQAISAMIVVTLALAAIWLGAVLLGGFVSALRGALWSTDALR